MKLIKNKIILSLLIAVFVVPSINANNGQDLFKQNCSACHKVDAKVIGPGLKGVKAKWVDAGEEANLIKWVQNAPELFKSGESQLAKDIWDFSPSEMTIQTHLTENQINEIFDYVENYVPEEVVEVESENLSRKPGEALSDEVIYSTEEAEAINKERNGFNRMVFFFLLFLAVCLLGGIVSISKTIQTFLTLMIRKGQTPKNDKPSGKGNTIASLVLLLIMSTPFSGFSMTIDTDISGWLIVSDIDIMVLFLGNLLLFWVLMDHKKTLKTVIAQYDVSLLKKRSLDGKEVKE
ncbi:MAG: c-type cytochrome, partial [Vicingaceae bacterium]|nr:c-type cytochrome [Vicingaceae bacterium]